MIVGSASLDLPVMEGYGGFGNKIQSRCTRIRSDATHISDESLFVGIGDMSF
jgi:hypothetical protein